MQSVKLTGRLTQEIDYNEFPNEKGISKVAKSTIAVKRHRFSKKDNERKSDFFRIEAWGNLAETLKNYTSKGALVDLIGEFHNNNYEDKEGNKRYEIVFQVEYLELLESRAVSEARKRNNQGEQMNQQPPYTQEPAGTVYHEQHEPPAYPYNQPNIPGMNQYGGHN